MNSFEFRSVEIETEHHMREMQQWAANARLARQARVEKPSLGRRLQAVFYCLRRVNSIERLGRAICREDLDREKFEETRVGRSAGTMAQPADSPLII